MAGERESPPPQEEEWGEGWLGWALLASALSHGALLWVNTSVTLPSTVEAEASLAVRIETATSASLAPAVPTPPPGAHARAAAERSAQPLPHPIAQLAVKAAIKPETAEPTTKAATKPEPPKPKADPPALVRQEARAAKPQAEKPKRSVTTQPAPAKPAAGNGIVALGDAEQASRPAPSRGTDGDGDAPFVEARHEGGGLSNPPPRYPFVARRQGWEGRVLVGAAVTAAGAVIGVELRASSGYAVLDQAALEAVRGWRFIPARRGARAVATRVEVPVSFRLREAR